MKIEMGKSYVTRGHGIVTVIAHDPKSTARAFQCSTQNGLMWYSERGTAGGGRYPAYDIVRPASEKPGGAHSMGNGWRRDSGRSIAMVGLLAVAVSLVPNASQAADIAWLANKAGGEIILTDDSAEECGSTARVILARANDGDVMQGCWSWSESGYIYALFSGDRVRMWKLTDFKLFDAPKKPAAARGKELRS